MGSVLLSGVCQLDPVQLRAVAEWVSDKRNWATLTPKTTKTKKKAKADPEAEADAEVSPPPAAATKKMKKKVKAEAEAELEAEASPAGAAKTIAVAPRSGGGCGGLAAQGFIIPKPGVDGAPTNSLAGKTIVLTGIFPELGGGSGLNLGKERTKSMIVSFGGRVTSSVSGKTDIVLAGKEPGMSKVNQARAKSIRIMQAPSSPPLLLPASFF